MRQAVPASADCCPWTRLLKTEVEADAWTEWLVVPLQSLMMEVATSFVICMEVEGCVPSAGFLKEASVMMRAAAR